ncbi:hypothetical protein BACT_0732 [Bifidobacterium actinocoloniiforme DSM 22766]|uniref:Uncharacterized protein n=1 Tax=Bifidobacterium actinocoloniiforme DSM 22766 TaxID=1437605 RepID=A0A086Z0I0_9BIFI|nr:hypothetical protein [Bifidobacterium actinocoloniiforme]AKV55256.1 hypothetical protein AB656_02265 [Bifidobacterium actinocoloniiforme DSM 22766]KFI40030.1 hypothetical protein BACT_0732 [Bifidobacterium actinocoloniiforme DSM 22766]
MSHKSEGIVVLWVALLADALIVPMAKRYDQRPLGVALIIMVTLAGLAYCIHQYRREDDLPRSQASKRAEGSAGPQGGGKPLAPARGQRKRESAQDGFAGKSAAEKHSAGRKER